MKKSEDEIRQEIAVELVSDVDINQKGIELRSVCYRLGIGLLVIEVIVLVAAFALQ